MTSAQLPGDPPGGRRAVAVWGLGVAVYFVAITYRTSLGVAGIDAAERFHINASALSTFSILQVLVYAGMQIPVGLMVDRLGTRKVLMLGVVLFTLGQFGFAFSHSYPMALGSRALLGCGDAMTFISVLRLGSRWFPARRGPMIAQVAALFGMAGNLVSTLVIARALHSAGWTTTFAGSALGGVAVLGLVLFFLKDHPKGFEPAPASHMGADYVRRQIADAWREPGTRLGMWVHFTTQFPAMVFLLLWGMPFLVEAQGLSRATAGQLLTLVVLSNMAVGLVYGQVIARHHAARAPLALGTAGATALLWGTVLLWPSAHAPMWLLIVLCAVLGACGPASMIGFDFARPANPPERIGTASGIVNMGGFTASMTTLLAVGVLLDLTGENFRIAFASVFVLQAVGVAQILRLRGRAHRRERERVVASRVEAVHVPA
ncbi:MFS transporter [Streptomyces rapamycinicus]|uniref:MFS transporter n=2 Tax=Streptomyces rapamycinicus TaxID=1226757 RepID=A0A0A0NGY5_STRRN|nr:MFS transporter [Streptomyces rapamycinicus]AGP56456.1 transporter [Streptomyces rapamycinicus NRRL 5491]MBB4784056.1 MFS family permease [Streptomyces rapamycinicus]RLV80459.1 MFS transporter [Streptomyces rapamycinicus NRRL 5491]UTO64399.1 MFS transporter [Streptomyces rapamycinicus]UTP32355.1 MFS transporter [Streptomyces rapamycinicus NRRL 5491]